MPKRRGGEPAQIDTQVSSASVPDPSIRAQSPAPTIGALGGKEKPSGPSGNGSGSAKKSGGPSNSHEKSPNKSTAIPKGY